SGIRPHSAEASVTLASRTSGRGDAGRSVLCRGGACQHRTSRPALLALSRARGEPRTNDFLCRSPLRQVAGGRMGAGFVAILPPGNAAIFAGFTPVGGRVAGFFY